MQIPAINYKRLGTQSRGRFDIAVPQRRANQEFRQATALGNARVQLVKDRTGVVTKALDTISAEAFKHADAAAQADAQAALAESQFSLASHMQTVNQKEYFAPSELPAGVMKPGLSQYGDQIPRSKVMAGLLDNHTKTAIDGNRDKLGNKAYSMWLEAFQPKMNQAQLTTQAGIIKGEIDYRKVKDQQAVDSYMKAGDTLSAITYIQDSVLYSPAEKAAKIPQLREIGEKMQIRMVIDRGDPDQMHKELMLLEDPGYAGVLGPKDKTTLKATLRTEITKQTKTHRAAYARENARKVSDLEVAISRGGGSFPEIEALYEQGAMTASKRTQMVKAKDSANQKVQITADRSRLLSSVLAGDTLADPFNKELQTAVDEAYAADTSDETGVVLAVKTGTLPSQMIAGMNAIAFNGTPDQRKGAAQAMEALQQEKPITLRKVPKQTQAILEVVSRMSPLVPPDEIQKVVDSIRAQTPSELEQKQFKYTIEKKELDPIEQLDDLMGASKYFDKNWGPYAEVPADELPANITGDYLYLHEQYYLMTGDAEVAAKLSHRALTSVYAATEVNGDWQVMKYAPEEEYNLTGDQVRLDFSRHLDTHGLPPDTIMASDYRTSVETAKTYAVYTFNEDGLPEEQVVRYAPDTVYIMEVEREEELEAAREKRETYLRGKVSLEKFYQRKDVGGPGPSSQTRKKSIPEF